MQDAAIVSDADDAKPPVIMMLQSRLRVDVASLGIYSVDTAAVYMILAGAGCFRMNAIGLWV